MQNILRRIGRALIVGYVVRFIRRKLSGGSGKQGNGGNGNSRR